MRKITLLLLVTVAVLQLSSEDRPKVDLPKLVKLGAVVFKDDFSGSLNTNLWHPPASVAVGVLKVKDGVLYLSTGNSEYYDTILKVQTENLNVYTLSF
jgi:hypothetical protein